MDVGNAARLACRFAPELLDNEKSLAHAITKLRAQVPAIERNGPLSGTALPAWLLRALTDVANNSDAVVESQAMHEQVNGLQKEVLELRHELLLQQSAMSAAASTGGFNPTPHPRLSTGSSIRGIAARRASVSTKKLSTGDPTETTAEATAASLSSDAEQFNMELVLKPLWEAIHKQTNALSALKQNFTEAKDTVARLQSEIKRRDAVVQARNAKHESVVQSQVEKINEAMRACVTRNDLIAAEQRIAQQMKADRQHVLEDVETRSNKILEDLLTSRSDQEDINSQNAEQMEMVARKQARMEDHVIELMKKHTEGQQTINDMRLTLSEAVAKVESNSSEMDVLQEKVTSFEDTQEVVRRLGEDMLTDKAEAERLRAEQDNRMVEKMGETATAIRGELAAVNAVVTELVAMNLDSEVKALGSKLDVVQLNVADVTRKIGTQQKQLTTHADHTHLTFSIVFDPP